MLTKRVDEFIKSLPSDHRGAVRLHPLVNRAARGDSLTLLYAQLLREQAILSAAFKAAEMIANETATCRHEFGHVVEGVTEFYFGTWPLFTRCCKQCSFKEEHVASRTPDTDELTQLLPEWVTESFKDKVPYWALTK